MFHTITILDFAILIFVLLLYSACAYWMGYIHGRKLYITEREVNAPNESKE